ncbi:MAG: hypothetical protein M0T74_12625 [Desulfitobacterium hafniense]|nr:hypothetical protein [Desulfitobacterium hafniense]
MKEKVETKKYTDFTPEHIKKYLDEFRKLILKGNYSISINKNRQKNTDFIETYQIDTKKEREIFLALQYEDFCYAVDNEKEAYSNERLYIFCKEYELDNWGTTEYIEIYIKTNILQTKRGDDFLIVVSFHKRNKPIKFQFK